MSKPTTVTTDEMLRALEAMYFEWFSKKVDEEWTREQTRFLCMPQGDLAGHSLQALRTTLREAGVRVKEEINE